MEKASGANFDRIQYQALRERIREGDLIYIDALDRLGRSYDEVIAEWKYITRMTTKPYLAVAVTSPRWLFPVLLPSKSR